MNTTRSSPSLPTSRLAEQVQVFSALFMAVACAVVVPTAMTWGLLWSACRIECGKFGWIAISYAQMPAYLTATTLVAWLGYYAYRTHRRLAPRHQHQQITWIYGVACAVLLVVAGAIPALDPAASWLAAMVGHIAKQL